VAARQDQAVRAVVGFDQAAAQMLAPAAFRWRQFRRVVRSTGLMANDCFWPKTGLGPMARVGELLSKSRIGKIHRG